MIGIFVRGMAALGDPAIRAVLWLSVGISVAVYVVLWLCVGALLTQLQAFETPWIETVVDVLGGLGTVFLSILFFPAVVSATIGAFLETVAERVEARNYPGLPAARSVSFSESIAGSLRFLGIVVAANVFILFFLLVPPVFPFVFFGVNAYLLSREYFELVALRRAEPKAVQVLRRANRGQLIIFGLVVTFLLTLPFINLLAPLVATAAMVHLYHRLTGRRGTLPAH